MNAERIEKSAKNLGVLDIGNHVYIQNQHGNSPKLWTKSGVIVEKCGFDSYLVKIDGSGVLTRRNRQFLRKFTPFGAVGSVVMNTEVQDMCHIEQCESQEFPVSVATLLDSPLATSLALGALSLYDDKSLAVV